MFLLFAFNNICLSFISPYPGIYCVLLSLLVIVTIHTCIAQKPDLIIRYGKSFPSRPRQMPRSPFYAKRNEVFLQSGNNDFPSDFARDEQMDTDKAAIDGKSVWITTPWGTLKALDTCGNNWHSHVVYLNTYVK